MGFWEDASPAVKGTIIVGGLLLVYLGIAFVGGFIPFGGGASDTTEVSQTRGLGN